MNAYTQLQPVTMRDKVNLIEEFGKTLAKVALKDLATAAELSQTELITEHFFSPGIYTRVLYIPKGCLLTGKIHKEPILNIMIKGDISVLLGDEVRRVVAPFMGVSPAGSKKIGYAHEDTIWVGCHGTDETDVAKIESRFVAQNEQEWIEHKGDLRLRQISSVLKDA